MFYIMSYRLSDNDFEIMFILSVLLKENCLLYQQQTSVHRKDLIYLLFFNNNYLIF